MPSTPATWRSGSPLGLRTFSVSPPTTMLKYCSNFKAFSSFIASKSLLLVTTAKGMPKDFSKPNPASVSGYGRVWSAIWSA